MKILIDADGCPVVDITIEVAKKLGIEVILMCDTSHIFNKQGIETIILSKGADSVDFALVNKVKKDDIVVTQDYGLAAMVLAKSGNPINQMVSFIQVKILINYYLQDTYLKKLEMQVLE